MMRTALMIGLVVLGAAAARGSSNLVVNGSFNQAGDQLLGWQTTYQEKGESWYADNHKLVSVVSQEGGRGRVLCLNVATQFLADNPGVKVDSQPIPVKPDGKYRISAWARSNGPDIRLLVEGYRLRPGVPRDKPPTLYDLRKVYKFEPLYFGKVKGGTMGGVGRTWSHATMTFPEAKSGGLSELAKKKFNEIEYLVVHIVGIGGVKGEVYVDDVELERLN